MKYPAKSRVRHVAAAAAMAVLALGAAGCGAVNQQATTLQYNASDGVAANVGTLHARNMVLVTNGADAQARFIGSVSNSGTDAGTLTVSFGGKDMAVEVPAGAPVNLEDDSFASALTVDGSGKDAGAGKTTDPGLDVKVTFSDGSATEEVSVPVVTGALKEYAPFVPGGYDESNNDHLKPVEKAEHGE